MVTFWAVLFRAKWGIWCS